MFVLVKAQQVVDAVLVGQVLLLLQEQDIRWEGGPHLEVFGAVGVGDDGVEQAARAPRLLRVLQHLVYLPQPLQNHIVHVLIYISNEI